MRDQRFRLSEREVPGKPLGRHVWHDPRSWAFRVAADSARIASVDHAHRIPVLDQGDLGSCTGNAAAGALGTDPLYPTLAVQIAAGLRLDEAQAVRLYSVATQLDDFDGTYPPDDTGSSGLAVAKAAKSLGYIAGYQHATSVDELKTALATYPVLIGIAWKTGCDDPDSRGVIRWTGSVRGGHELLVVGYDSDGKLFGVGADTFKVLNSWSAKWGVGGYCYLSGADLAAALEDDGDATVFLPVTVPAPTPNPTPQPVPTPPPGPGAASFLDADPDLAFRVDRAAARARLTREQWLLWHLHHYFGMQP